VGDGDHDQGDAQPVAGSTDAMVRDAGRSMLAFRTVQQGNHCVRDEFLYELKAGPASHHGPDQQIPPGGVAPLRDAVWRRLLIARRGHGSIILVYPEDGPKVLAGIRRFIADQSQP
jgi:hypothetical protein